MKGIINKINWYQEIGVDIVLHDSPINRKKSSLPPGAEKKPEADIPHTELKGESAWQKKIDLCNNIDELRHLVNSYDGCEIKQLARNTVFSDGQESASVMIIGEAPGENEDIQGKPFVGESGKLLDIMLKTINLSRQENVYITNALFWRPPGNRKPHPEELQMCRPFLEKHISLIAPKLILSFGSTAAKVTINSSASMLSLRGKIHEYCGLDRKIPTIVTYHPSYLLRNPNAKRASMKDMLFIKKTLSDLS